MSEPTLPSESIKAIIITGLLGSATLTAAWAVYVSAEPPETPNAVITVYDTGGRDPDPKWKLDYPNVQIRVRGEKSAYSDAWIRTRKIRDLILGSNPQVIGQWRWESFLVVGDVNFIAYDQSRRPIFTINVRLIGEPLWTEPNRLTL